MTKLLASVTDLAEAETAIAGDADIIDFKEPTKGALGACDPAAVRLAVDAIAGRRPTSAVTGDQPMQPDVVVAAAERMAATGVDFVKVGLFPDPRRADCISALARLAQRTKLVGVMFADCAPDLGLLRLMAGCGFAGAMLDTAQKAGGRLLDCADIAALREFVRACRAWELLVGLAGSLEAPDVPRLLLLTPDYLGFRRALCASLDRRAGLDPAALQVIRALIPQDRYRPSGSPGNLREVDFRVLAARGYSGAMAEEATDTDRVFVQDFVLPVRIGAYGHEVDRPQNVRFDVVADIARADSQTQDMRDVLSYNVITDGIRLIAADGHIAVVETLAERIAGFALSHPQVRSVTVRVEKLEAGPGRVGVEIRRHRTTERAKVYQLYPAAAARNGSGRSK